MNNEGRMFLFETYIHPHTVGAEIGVWHGHFSRVLIQQDLAALHLIDPWYVPPEKRWVRVSIYEETPDKLREEFPDLDTLFIHKGYSQDVVHEFHDEYFDWVYVDGDHSYEGASSDLRLYTPKLKPGGLMICDDYSDRGPWGRGVIEAVDEAVATGLLDLVEIVNEQAILSSPSPA